MTPAEPECVAQRGTRTWGRMEFVLERGGRAIPWIWEAWQPPPQTAANTGRSCPSTPALRLAGHGTQPGRGRKAAAIIARGLSLISNRTPFAPTVADSLRSACGPLPGMPRGVLSSPSRHEYDLFPMRARLCRGFIAVFCLVLVGCGAEDERSATPGQLDLLHYDRQARAVLAQMSLEEKAGQMAQAEVTSLADLEEISTLSLGSLLNGGDADPAGNRAEDWADLYERAQRYALRSRLQIPLLYGVDAVHGHSNVVGAVIFPHNVGLGCTRNPRLVEEIGVVTAREMRATGLHWTFAPTVAVARDERWGRTYESFSEDPQVVAELGAALVRGLQRGGLATPQAVLATPKHFLADGGTLFGTGTPPISLLDQGDVRIPEEGLRRIHLTPYRTALAAGAASIMVSYSSWKGTKMSAQRYWLTDVLKRELGFAGFLLSDYNAIDQLHPDYKTAVRLAIGAGIDMGMVPQRYREFIRAVVQLVQEGQLSRERVDDAVLRILRVKFAMGLMERDQRLWPRRDLLPTVGSAEHRALARRAVRESLVLLKNSRRTLPLSKAAQWLHVVGFHADNLGYQCGGWTITWQGGSGRTTEGTTILQAVRAAVSGDTRVTFSEDGSGGQGADAVIAVIGERPYAEYVGDRADLTLPPRQIELLERAKASGAPLVVILITGRPLILGRVLDLADALLVVWLPGTEGQGVTDVLFGDFAPTGKLSFTWPRSMEQIPLNVGDRPYDPAFPFGFGLTYDPALPRTRG